MDIVINVGRQSDGYTYELDPRSRRKLVEEFPSAQPAPSVFVGHERRADPDKVQRSFWKQVAQILTGLDWEQLRQLGEIRIMSPADGLELGKVA